MTVKSRDALGLLAEQHKAIKTLFEQFDGLPEDARFSRKEVVRRICRLLTLHTAVESEVFYPAVRASTGDDALLDEAIREHASATTMIAEIEDMDPTDDLYPAKVKLLSRQIDDHVRDEEGQMFARIRGSGLDLTELGATMSARMGHDETDDAAA